ncbi:hypothetical protein PVAND_010654 [Polypedilum vanderplanki]|uniref:Uncharacterized protein n=1 Tax=Polypedilum vanderplanki TaxID=319348 RepID=A0A9J6CGY6_POLVA|nr:hypothetical protein PVAND_010654 [Polypedilum vanderplanki]
MELTKNFVYTFLYNKKSEKLTKFEIINSCLEFIEEHVERQLTISGRTIAYSKIENMYRTYQTDYAKYNNSFNLMRERLTNWDTVHSEIPDDCFLSMQQQSTSGKRGRPKKNVEDLGRSGWYNKINKAAEFDDYNEKFSLCVAKHIAEHNGSLHLKEILNMIIKAYENGNVENLRLVNAEENDKPEKLSPEEALREILYTGLSKRTYQNIKNILDRKKANVLPPYNQVREAKQACRPSPNEMNFEDTKASVSLRAVSEHTIKRTLEMKRRELEQLVERQANLKLIETEFIFSRGGDSSTGQAQYQQKSSDGNLHDQNSLFAASITPLLWRTTNGEKFEIWKNLIPRSPDCNRPLLLQFHKETEDFVRKCFEKFKKEEKEINEDPFLFVFGESVIQVKCKFYDTLIDVKVANILAEQKGSQRCFICNKTPSQFNNMTEFLPVNDGLCQYGFSQLHFIINAFRFLLNLASKNIVKKYRNLDANQKKLVEARRNEIITKLKDEFGIIFEQPRTGGAGTTTNGNACRKVFAEPEKLNEILNLDLELVNNISIIVSLLHQLEDIDVEKFEKLCTNTHQKFFGPGGIYHWYLLSPTVHKILAHSTQIMAVLPMAPGYFSEESLEAHHKIYKQFRLHFARKESRLANIKDVFLRAMDKSDPQFFTQSVSIRLERKISKPLPERAQQYIRKEAQEAIIDDEFINGTVAYTDNFDASLDNGEVLYNL